MSRPCACARTAARSRWRRMEAERVGWRLVWVHGERAARSADDLIEMEEHTSTSTSRSVVVAWGVGESWNGNGDC